MGCSCRDSAAIVSSASTRPSPSTATRSLTCHSRSRSWLTITMVGPNSACVRRISSSTPAALAGSSPEVGSSRNSSSGSSAMARASAARLSMPPLSSPGSFSPASGGRPVSASFHSAIWSISASSSVAVLAQRQADVLAHASAR